MTRILGKRQMKHEFLILEDASNYKKILHASPKNYFLIILIFGNLILTSPRKIKKKHVHPPPRNYKDNSQNT